jgi:hypothetical protein
MKSKATAACIAAILLAGCVGEAPEARPTAGQARDGPVSTVGPTSPPAASATTAVPSGTPTAAMPDAAIDQILAALSDERESSILVLVRPRLLSDLSAELTTLQMDMRCEGWAPVLSESAVSSAQELRRLLQTVYAQKPFAGLLLVGEFPYARMWGYPVETTDDPGPADYYLMDLDGEWLDEDGDSFFDRHEMGLGDRDPEIFVGRLSGHSVTVLGQSEVKMVQDYLARNHAYRTGALSTQTAAIYATYAHHHYGRVDPSSADWSRAEIRSLAGVFSRTFVFIFEDEDDQGCPLPVADWPAELWLHPNSGERTVAEARDRLLQLLGDGYDYLSIGIHGWHGGWGGLVTVDDVRSIRDSGGQLPILVASSSCSTGDISRGDDMGSVLTMSGSLVFFGFAASTELTWEEVVYWNESLPDSAVGPAFKMLQDLATPDWDGVVTRNVNWILLGDPTLRVPRLRP